MRGAAPSECRDVVMETDTMWFALALAVIVSLVGFVFFIILAVGAFRQHVLWGLAVLFVPFAALVYAILHWPVAKKPFLASTACSVLSTMLLVMFMASAGAQMAEMAQAQMEAEMIAAAQRAESELNSLESSAPAPSNEPGYDARQALNGSTGPNPTGSYRSAYDASQPGAPANLYPHDGPIEFASARRYVGERLRITGSNGMRLSGRLVGADSERILFEKSIGSGTVSMEFAPNEIASMELLRR